MCVTVGDVSLLQISVKHIQDESHLAKGKTVSRTCIEMGHALYIIRYYTPIRIYSGDVKK